MRAAMRDARTRVYHRRRMTPCGSIISQKSDNWFINAFAASAIYATDLLRHFETWRRSLSAFINAVSISQGAKWTRAEYFLRPLKTSDSSNYHDFFYFFLKIL